MKNIYSQFDEDTSNKFSLSNKENLYNHLKLLESVILSTSDIVIITEAEPIDTPGPIIIYVNEAFSLLTGYSSEEVIGKSPRILQGKNTDRRELDRLKRCLKNWEKCEITVLNYKKNGEEFWNNMSVSPVSDKNGWFTHWISIERDVTAIKNEEFQKAMAAEEIIRVYAERNTILETIGDAFFAVDKNWIITYWNYKAEILLGKTRLETLGKHLNEIYDKEKYPLSYLSYNKALNENKEQHFEKYFTSLNLWFEISAYPSVKGLSIYFRDITERKEASEKIRLSNERFERVAQATNDIIWDWDIINNTFNHDDRFRSLFGHEFGESNNDLESSIRHIHPDDIYEVETSLQNAIHNREQLFWEAEYRYCKSDKSYAYVIDRGSIIRNSGGDAIRMIGAMSDITHRKKIEQSLEILNSDLMKSNEQLININKQLEQFSFVASHDLQEPLRMISNFLGQIKNKYANKIDEKGKKYIRFAVDAAKHMKLIISDLLMFSRVGKTHDQKEQVDLNEILQQILLIFEKPINESAAIIKWENIPVIQTYRTKISLVFQNLIGNALKYVDKTLKPYIIIKYLELENHLQFSVSDNGIGIESKYFEKIFAIFQRLHKKEEFSGSGIGLAIVKKIVENLGGKIWVESEMGKGSCFYFTIRK